MCNASAALRIEPWCATASTYSKIVGGCTRQRTALSNAFSVGFFDTRTGSWHEPRGASRDLQRLHASFRGEFASVECPHDERILPRRTGNRNVDFCYLSVALLFLAVRADGRTLLR